MSMDDNRARRRSSVIPWPRRRRSSTCSTLPAGRTKDFRGTSLARTVGSVTARSFALALFPGPATTAIFSSAPDTPTKSC